MAVLTDLRKGGSRPMLAVKITTVVLKNMAGGPPKVGDRLVASSLYFGDTGTGAWQDFSPLIVNLACSDLPQIKRALESIDPRDWQILQQAMTSLKPVDLGLHHLEV